MLAVGALAQDAPEWQLHNFHSTISVAADGSAVILERLDLRCYLPTARGTDFHGVQRLIPVESAGALATDKEGCPAI